MGGDDINRARTRIPLDAGAVAAKLAWLAEHEPERLAAAHVIVSPRDLVVCRMTDQFVTDATFASRSGLYDFDGNAVRELAGPALGKLPSVVASDTVVGQLNSVPGAELGLRPGIPVVIGAGDRQCEVLGSGRVGGPSHGELGHHGQRVGAGQRASRSRRPAGAVVTRAADSGWLLEGGLSAAGSFLAWLGRLLGSTPTELARLAGESPPGARGVVAVPVARRRPGSVVARRRPGRLRRAGRRPRRPRPGPGRHRGGGLGRAPRDGGRRRSGVSAARRPRASPCGGAGSGLPVWVEVLTSVLGVPALRHRSGEAASAGAALLAGRSLGLELSLEQLDPVEEVIEPDPGSVEVYRGLRPMVDHVAEAVIEATDSLPERPSAPG